jgi:methylmalonyl-CoA mutase cobalamin-binding domain/chain
MIPIRILTAVPICDGHDSAINTVNLELSRNGIEVVYLGYNRSAKTIARAAIQEDALAIGISSYNGGHVEFFDEVLHHLHQWRVEPEMGIFGGGGGTITHEDAMVMAKRGVDRIFFAGTPLTEMLSYVKTRYGAVNQSRYDDSFRRTDQYLARELTLAEKEAFDQTAEPEQREGKQRAPGSSKVIGFTGPGGAGKTTLIDELVYRFLRCFPDDDRLAVLSHDPSIVGSGALIGDRASMIYSQNDRIFMRSLATRGQAGGLSPSTNRCLDIVVESDLFKFVLVETVGTGQEAIPFGIASPLVDSTVLVMSPDYGSALQLQKIAMIDAADIIVLNKSDLEGSLTASAEIESRLLATPNRKKQTLIGTQANLHNDRGVSQIFDQLFVGARDVQPR